MTYLLKSRFAKLLLGVVLIAAGWFTGGTAAVVHADSPVTSTAFYTAYLDVQQVAEAADNGLTSGVVDFLKSKDTPLDQKAAAVNALYASDIGWSERDQANEYARLAYGKNVSALDKSALAPAELFVIGYLQVLDHYLEPDISLITEAAKELPGSLTAALIQALAASQVNMDCSWALTGPVLADATLTKDMRQEAVDIITDYMALYKDYSCQNGAEQTEAALLAGDIIKDSVVLSVGYPQALVKGSLVSIDAANSTITPLVQNGRTLVPLKFIAERFGAAVSWNAATKQVTVTYNKQKKVIPAALTRNGRTYVALRTAMELFGKQLYYRQGLIIISDHLVLDAKDPLDRLADERVRVKLLGSGE